MRISHSQLESCRSDPVRWVAAQRDPQRGGFGYAQATKLAICQYEKTRNPGVATTYLRHLCRNFKDIRRVDACEGDLQLYVDWRESDASLFASCCVRVRLPLGDFWTLGGEVTRVDVLLEGDSSYRGILLGAHSPQWAAELRMPLLQRGLARLFARDEEDFQVGVQEFDASGLSVIRFSQTVIDNAAEEAREIAGVLTREWISQMGGEPAR